MTREALPRSPRPSPVRPVVAGAASLMVGTAVYLAGRRVVPVPPLDPARWPRWWAVNGPVVPVFGIARLAIMAIAAAFASAMVGAVVLFWLCGPTAEQIMSRVLRLHLPGRSTLARAVLGISASGAVIAGCGSSGMAPTVAGPASTSAGPPPAVSGHHVPAAPILYDTAPAPPEATTPPPPPAPAPAPPPSPGPPPSEPPASPGPPISEPPASPAPSAAPPRTWVVQPGDCLWSIAAATVQAGAAPPGAASPDRVAAYWVRLMAANRDRLPVPSDPSLLFAGDVLVLPEAPPPAS